MTAPKRAEAPLMLNNLLGPKIFVCFSILDIIRYNLCPHLFVAER